jgi:hypothetical protein
MVPVTGQLVWVIAEPGDTPTFPMMVVSVHVTAVRARTAKFAEVPSEDADDDGDGGAALFFRASSLDDKDGEEASVEHASRVTRGMNAARRKLRSMCVLRARDGANCRNQKSI